jgi:cyclic pyranopterin phosphate synthase
MSRRKDSMGMKCVYCTPFCGRSRLRRSQILTYEELQQVVEAAVSVGISKIRITGGEPLIRNGVVDLCRMISSIQGIKSVALTTNGVRLEKLAQPLKSAGVKRVNVSLDTLDPERFKQITGRDMLPRVFAGIREAEAVGMSPVKINTVAMKGINDDEIAAFARLTLTKPYHVRFIELMPSEGWGQLDHRTHFLSAKQILDRIPEIRETRFGQGVDSFGPARLFSLPAAAGKIGVIAPVTRHFCSTCNRLRLTADGKLRSCLFAKQELDIKARLRQGASTEELADIFRLAVVQKPHRHHLQSNLTGNGPVRAMYAIGG